MRRENLFEYYENLALKGMANDVSGRKFYGLTPAEKYYIQKLNYCNKIHADVMDIEKHLARGRNIDWQDEYLQSWNNDVRSAYYL